MQNLSVTEQLSCIAHQTGSKEHTQETTVSNGNTIDSHTDSNHTSAHAQSIQVGLHCTLSHYMHLL